MQFYHLILLSMTQILNIICEIEDINCNNIKRLKNI